MKNVDLTLRLLAKDQASGELQKVQRSASTVGDSFKKMGAVAAGALAGVSIASFAKDSIAAASDLNESISKTGVIFGESAGAIKSFAGAPRRTSACRSGPRSTPRRRSPRSVKAAGLTGNDLTAFSTQLHDAVRRPGVVPQHVPPSRRSPPSARRCAGESEPIRQYGVLLDDATLRQRAFEMGLISTTKNALTPQQKALAAQAEIMAQTSDAQGDFARTSDGLANKQRIPRRRGGERAGEDRQAAAAGDERPRRHRHGVHRRARAVHRPAHRHRGRRRRGRHLHRGPRQVDGRHDVVVGRRHQLAGHVRPRRRVHLLRHHADHGRRQRAEEAAQGARLRARRDHRQVQSW